MADIVDMWRLRLAKGTANSGGGSWSYHESRESLEDALFSAAVEFESHKSPKTNDDMRKRHRWDRWRRANGGEDLSGEYVVQRIVAVEHLDGDKWVEVSWSISPPVLHLAALDVGVGEKGDAHE